MNTLQTRDEIVELDEQTLIMALADIIEATCVLRVLQSEQAEEIEQEAA